MTGSIRKRSPEEMTSVRPGLEELRKRERFPIVAVLENIRSLYNVGSIFRTSDGALVEKLYLTGFTGHPPRKEIDKTSLGSTESVPWEHHADATKVVIGLKNEGYRVVSLEHTDRSVPYAEASYDFPLCLVVGNEVGGISDELVSLCDSAVEIPMYGVKGSLNVAVAYGIVVYHLVNEYRLRR